MKIGPIDVSIPGLCYVAGCVVGVSLLLQMYSYNKDTRVESICRSFIMRGMNDDNPDSIVSGIEKCKYLIDLYPKKVSTRLYLGSLLLRQKQYQDAQAAFADVLEKVPDATAQEKAWALVGQGVAVFASVSTSSKDAQAKAAVKSEEFFKKALEQENDNPDAIVNLGLVQLLKTQSGNSAEQAEKYCKQALASSKIPSLAGLTQLHNLNGLILLRQGKFSESTFAFERAHALQGVAAPASAAANNSRLARLGTITQPGLDSKLREELIIKTQRETQLMPENQRNAARNAMGVAWTLIKNKPEWYETARMIFIDAINADRKDPQAYLNLAELYEDHIKLLGAKLTVPVTGICGGESSAVNPWMVNTVAVNTVAVNRFERADVSTLAEIRKNLKDEFDVWSNYLKTVIPPLAADRINAVTRQLSCVRRQFYLLDITAESERPDLRKRELEMANEIIAIDPKDPIGNVLLGRVYVDNQEYVNARKAFESARQLGKIPPDVQTGIEKLSVQPTLVGQRPEENKPWFGVRPLIGATMKAVLSGGGIKEAKMAIDGKVVKPSIVGSQILYFPSEADISDGEHTATLSATFASDPHPIEFKPVKFFVDKLPPTWTVDPENNQPLASKAVWTITLADRSGIDPTSLSITLTSGKGKGITRNLVQNGRYKMALPDLGIKTGSFVDCEKPFKVASPMELSAGEYGLNIVVQDSVGNELKETKQYSVKGTIKVNDENEQK